MVHKKSRTDLLIIGAGPAGLMAANCAAQYGISIRVLDDKPDRVATGHADGLTCRSLEIFDSFGLAEVICREASWDIQIRNWNPDENGEIKRTQSIVAQKPGVSRFQQCTLNQGRIEELLLENLARSQHLHVERNVDTLRLQIHPTLKSTTEYPIEIEVHHKRPSKSEMATHQNGESTNGESCVDHNGCLKETIAAKYIIGADGAHSWTRRQLNLSMVGDTTAHVWGVIDIIPLTDFPDIRQTCVVNSKCGNVHLVPREGKIVRFYIQLDETVPVGERFDRSKITVKMLLAQVKKVFHPYKMDAVHVDWWTIYQVGQRIADSFSCENRAFLVGDAIHTHSPKIGQGMNVSMQDAFNLGWKLGSVVAGILKPEILNSYEIERRPVAEDLIRADQDTVKYYTERDHGIPREDLQSFRNKLYAFLSGVAIDYTGSLLIADGLSRSKWASGISLGQRLPSFQILNHANARPVHLANLMISDGRWRLVVFCGDLTMSEQRARVDRLGVSLSRRSSILHQYGSRPSRPGDVFQVITIMSNPRDSIYLTELPEVFHPWDDEMGWDYGVVFSDEPQINGVFPDAYGQYGVDRRRGCLILCRPDQHVAFIGELEDTDELEKFCEKCFVPLASGSNNI